MADATRSRAHNENVKPPASPVERSKLPSRPHSSTNYSRDDVSHLSQDLDPIRVVDRETPHHQEHPAGASEIHPLGLHVKDAIATISRLETLGLQRLKIPLPKCIVLGEQSTGKSSVIEAISEIKTPRSDDTCTRCPLFIKLEPSGDPKAGWTASVSLRREFGYDGKHGHGRERRFPGWIQLPQTNNVPFAETEDPNELERIIARAQLATISPLIDYKEFLRPSVIGMKDRHSCAFSPNIVCISITHPDLPALSFYDLPGTIGQAESEEEQFLVKFVRDLVTDYVEDPEALILVTCSLENDIANSTAGGIARASKATDRCIGVLTKPDRLPAGSRHDKLMEVFDQKRFALGHGYFVVKNLGQDEINQGFTHQQARAQEQQFFGQGVPWSTTFKQYSHRFGTLNLQRFLSGKLADQITKKLPIIEQEINTRLNQIETDLQQFPEPPTYNASRIITDIILDFCQELRKEVEAEFPFKTWRNNWKALQKAFFDALVSMKPTMSTSGQEDASVYLDVLNSLPGSSASKAISVSDNEDEADDVDYDDASSQKAPETPTKKRRIDSSGAAVSLPVKTPSRRGGASSPEANVRIPTPDFSDLKKKFSLDEVRKHLVENSQSKIPGQIEPRVVDNMMLETIEQWIRPLNEFFNTMEEQIRTHVKTLFQKHFRKWDGSTFFVNAWKIVEQVLNLNFYQQRTTMAEESMNDEKDGPYIFHEEIFEQEKGAVLDNYRQARLKARLNIYKRGKQRHTRRAMTAQEEERLKRDERTMAVLRHEPYEIELGAVVQVTAYYMLAARRFHDSVCMRIGSKFFKQLRTQLRDELENGLGLNDGSEGHRNAVHLLAEPPHRYHQRRELSRQRESLLQGQMILKDLQQKKYSTDHSPTMLNMGS
ncbi:dynamin family protein [Stemphylium lycopersici]|nr:dynamin family protein [Stemphylium lycopersici]